MEAGNINFQVVTNPLRYKSYCRWSWRRDKSTEGCLNSAQFEHVTNLILQLFIECWWLFCIGLCGLKVLVSFVLNDCHAPWLERRLLISADFHFTEISQQTFCIDYSCWSDTVIPRKFLAANPGWLTRNGSLVALKMPAKDWQRKRQRIFGRCCKPSQKWIRLLGGEVSQMFFKFSPLYIWGRWTQFD